MCIYNYNYIYIYIYIYIYMCACVCIHTHTIFGHMDPYGATALGTALPEVDPQPLHLLRNRDTELIPSEHAAVIIVISV